MLSRTKTFIAWVTVVVTFGVIWQLIFETTQSHYLRAVIVVVGYGLAVVVVAALVPVVRRKKMGGADDTPQRGPSGHVTGFVVSAQREVSDFEHATIALISAFRVLGTLVGETSDRSKRPSTRGRIVKVNWKEGAFFDLQLKTFARDPMEVQRMDRICNLIKTHSGKNEIEHDYGDTHAIAKR